MRISVSGRKREHLSKKENRKRKMESKQKAAYLAISAFVILTLALSVLTVCRVLAKAADAGKFEYPAAVSVPSVSAAAAVLIDADDGKELYAYHAEEKMYPASTTKIMTALVVLETMETLGLDLDSEIVVPAEAQGVEGSSIHLKAGERVSVEELLYGLMLQSGNDSAAALAACVGGSTEHFLDQMNRRAEELGCQQTHFANPSGLYDENHYTTARDLACIARAAMMREDFRQIVETKEWNSGHRTFVNKNKTVFQYEGGNGVKIGFTKASGRTLAASASRDGHEVIAVVLNDGNWFQDAYHLMDYGFSLLECEAEK